MAKYIVESDDNEFLHKILIGCAGNVNEVNLTEADELMPYVTLDLQKIKEDAFEEGRRCSSKEVIDHSCDANNVENNTYYNMGLDDAWKCIGKIINDEENGGISSNDLIKMFGYSDLCNIFRRHEISYIVWKIKYFEEERNKISVGDEVLNDDGTAAIILDSRCPDLYAVLTENRCVETWDIKDFRKTCNHFSEVDDMIDKLRKE